MNSDETSLGRLYAIAVAWWAQRATEIPWDDLTVGILCGGPDCRSGNCRATVAEPFSPPDACAVRHRVLVVDETDGRVIGITRESVVTASRSGRAAEIDLSDGAIDAFDGKPPQSVARPPDRNPPPIPWTIGDVAEAASRLCWMCADRRSSAVAAAASVAESDAGDDSRDGDPVPPVRLARAAQLDPAAPQRRGTVRPFDGCDGALLCDALGGRCPDSRDRDRTAALVANSLVDPEFNRSAAEAFSLVSAARCEIGRGDAAARAAAAFGSAGRAILPGGCEVAEVYVGARTADSHGTPSEFYRLSDGSRTDCDGASPVAGMVSVASEGSLHRNGTRAWVIFAVRPASVAVARRASPCRACAGAARSRVDPDAPRPPPESSCPMSMPPIAGGVAYVSIDDVAAASQTIARERFRADFLRGAQAIRPGSCAAACSCGVADGDRSRCVACSGTATVDPASADALCEAYGEEGVVALGPDGHAAREAIAGCTWAVSRRLSPWTVADRAGDPRGTDVAYEIDGSRRLRGTCAAQRSSRPGGPGIKGGFDELERSGWKIGAIREFMPPCAGAIVDACTTSRHPKYPERMLLLSMLSRIFGNDKRSPGLWKTWAALFEHPENESIGRVVGPATFAKSKYGERDIEDSTRFAAAGNSIGCRSLVCSGICPFATAAATDDDALAAAWRSEAGRIGKSGDPVPDEFAADYRLALASLATPPDDPISRAKRRCSAYASVLVSRTTYVTHPLGFYDMMYSMRGKR